MKVNGIGIEDIKNDILDYIVTSMITFEGNKDEISLNKSLIEGGYLDSYGIVSLVAFVEDKWSIEVEEDEFTPEALGTINSIAELVIGKLN